VEAFGVRAEALEVGAKAPLDGVEPSLPWIVAGVDAALFDQIVLELFENRRLEVAACLFPVRSLACFERDQLHRQARPRSPCQRGRSRDGAVPVLLQRVLELVIRQRLDLAVVALGDPFEKRFARVVAAKPLLDDRSAHRFAVLERCELVAHRGRVRPKAAKRSSLLTPWGAADCRALRAAADLERGRAAPRT
jgi:hypothetical protein